MPLEIRELVIRTAMTSDRPQPNSNPWDSDETLSEAAQAAIIAACVDQVLAVLQSRSER
jgi:Family of unknown function (DUF5908)